ncbi:MAG TPA: NAD-glutamate dehydrogenase domain-containing protein, partial [Nocardioides sp.]|nr:NAD-glutamate dehydrogenase domain-containing protein [Nocardioides sp.]
MTTDLEKSHLLTQAITLAERGSGTGGPPKNEVGQLLAAYYRHVAIEDLLDRSAEELYGALVSHYRTAESRPQGTASVHVFTPSLAEHGWSAGGHSVAEVVTDDMPFLVDSVVMELTRQQRDVHLVVHPQFDVTRDVTGRLEAIACPDSESATPPEGAERESWMHIEISRIGHDEDVEAIAADLQRVLRDVRESVEDWDRMRQQVTEIVGELEADPPTVLSGDEVERGRAFLQWLADDHFTFLGYREYHLEREGEDEYLRGVPGSGLGILRDDPDLAAVGKLPKKGAETARERTLLVLAKANSRATVHRPAYLDYVGVKSFDASGEVTGERRFLGLFSSAAYTESVWHVPLLREKAADVLKTIGLDPRSHAGKALIDTLETYPRDELFHTPVDELASMASRVMETRGRRQLRIFVRRDTYGRYVSVLVFLPRDRYNTNVRERFSDILKESFAGETIEFNVKMSESTTARVHFVVHPPKGERIPDVDVSDLERRLTDASRSWRDDFTAATIAEFGEDVGSRLARSFQASFPEAYKEDFSAATGALDLGRLEALGQSGTDLSLFSPLDAARGEARLKVFRRGAAISLSEVLPALSSMGVEVVDERPYQLDHTEHPSYIYEFGLRYPPGMPDQVREPFQDTIRAVWDGYNEIDGFNALVLGAGLTWRQATVLRAYAKYMKQGNSPFAVDYIEEALRGNTDITRLLVQLFEARFDPGRNGVAADAEARTARVEGITHRIGSALDDVASLDHDRILRSYLTHINATLRTNYFQLDDGVHHTYMSFKLEPSVIPDLPQPRPRFEIFVYSPHVEGVHLRFGAVARG